MKYFILAGEASGDLHGAGLVKALAQLDPQAELLGWGGQKMEQAGALLLKHYRELAFMGFWEVVKNWQVIRQNFKQCKAQISSSKPDVLILIDYPGFNLRMAKWAKNRGLRVFYYISPQLWAWHSSRVKTIKAYVDRMFVILPFELEFYARYGIEVDFVGHPLLDVIAGHPKNELFRSQHQLEGKPIIALLPGSRRQEIKRMLPKMLQLIDSFPRHQFLIATAPGIQASFYQNLLSGFGISGKQVKMLIGQTYDLLQHAEAAIVTSGTATLETALLKVPQLVVYRGNSWSYALAKWLTHVKYISLVNLILDRPLVTELIQEAYHYDNLRKELKALLRAEKREELLEGYEELERKLSKRAAAERAANLMIAYLNEAHRAG